MLFDIRISSKPLQKAEEDVYLLATATASKDPMEIDVIDIKEYYECLPANASSLVHDLSKDMLATHML
jgi:hypothetical protein